MTDTTELPQSIVERLRTANNDCSGNEPSLSVLQRAADEAADTIDRLSAERDAALTDIAELKHDLERQMTIANEHVNEAATAYKRGMETALEAVIGSNADLCKGPSNAYQSCVAAIRKIIRAKMEK